MIGFSVPLENSRAARVAARAVMIVWLLFCLNLLVTGVERAYDKINHITTTAVVTDPAMRRDGEAGFTVRFVTVFGETVHTTILDKDFDGGDQVRAGDEVEIAYARVNPYQVHEPHNPAVMIVISSLLILIGLGFAYSTWTLEKPWMIYVKLYRIVRGRPANRPPATR